jgi:dTDP-4-amino-4,6-dideoxygalactose transaminase
LAAAYDQALAQLPVLLPPCAAPGDQHSWHLYVVRLADAAAIGRDLLIERLHAAGIGCSVHYIPLHLQPYWRERYRLRESDFPNSQLAYERMISLPMYPGMQVSDVARVASAMEQALRG